MSDLAARMMVHSNESPLGCWRVALLQPHPALQDAVDQMWFVEGDVGGEVTRVLPRGNTHLMFNLGAVQRVVDIHGVHAPVEYRNAWFSGQQQRYLDHDSTGAITLVGVRFRPLGAWRVLGIDQHELAGLVVDLDDVLGDGILTLRQRLLDRNDPAHCFGLIEDWLLGAATRLPQPHYAVRWALRRLHESDGNLPIQALAAELGYSRKQLAQLFRREAGLSPKALARVLRFSRALARLRDSGTVHWDEFALDCGYYDQPHLIREFKTFGGHAPGELLRRPAYDDESVQAAR